MLGLTRKQHEALMYFRGIAETGGPSPTYSQIALALGLRSKSGVARLIDSLCQRGFLERIPFKTQSVRLHPSPPTYQMPVQKVVVPTAPYPPPDQARLPATRKRRTYVVELEADLHVRLRWLARKGGVPAEQIIADAVRWYVMEPKDEGEAD